jgi:serine/threonine protein phosphatase PrpC
MQSDRSPELSSQKTSLWKDVKKNSLDYKKIMGNMNIIGDPIPGFDFDSAYLDFENLGPKYIIQKNGENICGLSSTFELPGRQSAAIGYVYEKKTNKWDVMAFYKDTKNQWRHLSEYTIDSKTGKIVNTSSNDKENESLLPKIFQSQLDEIESNNLSDILFTKKILLSLARLNNTEEIPANNTLTKDTWEQIQPEDSKYKMVKQYVNKLVENYFPDNKISKNESIAEYLEPIYHSKTGIKDVYLSNTFKMPNGYDAAIAFVYNERNNTMDTKTIIRLENEKKWHLLESSQELPITVANKLSQLAKRKEKIFYSLAKDSQKHKESSPKSPETFNFEHHSSTYSHEGHPKWNEDRYFANGSWLAVFDGAGGQDGGEHASSIAKEYFEANIDKFPHKIRTEDIKNKMKKLVTDIDSKIDFGATTAVICKAYLDENNIPKIVFAWAGDSRLYLLRGTSIQVLTKDDNNFNLDQLKDLNNFDADKKDSSVSEYIKKLFEKRRAISQGLGKNEQGINQLKEVHVATYEIQPGDKIFAVSDGIPDNLTTQVIANTADRSTNLSEALVNKAIMVSRSPSIRAKRDDITSVDSTVSFK